jgi:hypothetical protein
MDQIDRYLIRASEIFLGDSSDEPDETDEELDDLLPPLVGAGYVAIDGESPTGYFWRFTPRRCPRAGNRQSTLSALDVKKSGASLPRLSRGSLLRPHAVVRSGDALDGGYDPRFATTDATRREIG